MSVSLTRRRLQLFLWYELPRKWLVGPEAHIAVADALGSIAQALEGPVEAPPVLLGLRVRAR